MSIFPKSIVCETSTVQDGNMDFRFGAKTEVIANRTNFLEHYGVAYQEHVPMTCTHGDIVTVVDHSFAVSVRAQGEQLISEVLITQKKHLALFLLTADCLPVSFYDPITETIALGHFSRATLGLKLPQTTVNFLHKHQAVDPKNLRIYVGPYIHKESYAFPLPLPHVHPVLAHFIEERDGFAYIDLFGSLVAQLMNVGVPKNNIVGSDIDTTTNKNYFSYYRFKKEGGIQDARMATMLMMR